MTIDKNKIGRLLICIGAVGLVVGIFVFLATRTPDAKEEGKRAKNSYVELPEAEENTLQGSKSDAYRDHREKRDNSNIENYWNSCSEDIEEDTDNERQSRTNGYPSPHPQAKSTTELFPTETPSPTARGSSSYTNPYRETPQQREERHQRRHEEAMELAGQLTSEDNTQETEVDYEEDPSTAIPVESSKIRRSGGISSMDDWDSSTGISSLEDDDEYFNEDAARPIKCMFARESKIKSGQRTSIILMEDLVINGTLVPKNTHLMAFCKISGRLEITVANLEINGRIIQLNYEGYDSDGNPGIYCPDVGSTGQTVRNRGTRMIGSGLSGKMGRTAGEIISTGVSIFQSASGEKTVTVPAGYTFFIVKKKH